MDEMKSPTKEQIEEALWNAGSGPAYILAAAYRSALARAELAERQYDELIETANAHGCMLTVKRHERERKELEA